MAQTPNSFSGPHRILIVDDNPSVHDAFDRILRTAKPDLEFEAEESLIFGHTEGASPSKPEFDLEHAFSGQEAIEKTAAALRRQQPFELAFVDIRMPGTDGVKTIEEIWKKDPHVQAVVCTAYADYRWEDLAAKFGRTGDLLVLKKPFHEIEVMQLASALTQKWRFNRQAALSVRQLEALVAQRTEKVLELQRREHQRQRDLDQIRLNSLQQMAREFRTPLTLIIHAMDELNAGTQGSAQKALVERQVRSMLKTLDSSLLIRPQDAALAEAKPARFDLISFLKGMAQNFAEGNRERNLRVAFTSDVAHRVIWLDPAPLEQALFSILSRLSETAPASSQIFVQLHIEEETARILVETTGGQRAKNELGVPELGEEDVAILLARETLKSVAGSLTVEALGGSRAHESCSRRIVLEFGLVCPPAMNQEPVRAEDPAPNPDEGQDRDLPLVLLIVENADLRRFISEGLGEGFRFLEEAVGASGLPTAREAVPDIIVIDYDCSQGEVLTVCAQLKNDEVTSHIPIILLGGDFSEAVQVKALNCGVDDCLPKPFRLPLLRARMGNLLETRRKWHDQAQESPGLYPRELAANRPEAEFLQRVIDIMNANMADYEFDVAALGQRLGVSRRQLFRKFKAIAGCTPNTFIRDLRLKRAARLLHESQLTISEIIYAVGFSDPKHFRSVFKERFGSLPAEYAKKTEQNDQ